MPERPVSTTMTTPNSDPEPAEPRPRRAARLRAVAAVVALLPLGCRPTDPARAVLEADRLVAKYHRGELEPKYRVGRKVTFGRAGNYGAFATAGWSGPEAGYTWTLGPRAVLRLPMDAAPATPLRLTIRARAFIIPPALMSQRILVSVGGVAVGEWTLTDGSVQEETFDVPASAFAGGPNVEVVLDLPDATSPVAIDYNPDPRILALAVSEVGLHE
jgi:hypothetical protein